MCMYDIILGEFGLRLVFLFTLLVKTMAAHFIAPTPRFGRVNNRLSIAHQQRSPYYWWWAYLRRNERYLKCCVDGGGGELTTLYAAFGDVREDDFHKWWTDGSRGFRLFSEQPLTVKFAELETADDWQSAWRKDDVMVVAVPLLVSKRQLKGAFAKLLDARHTGKQGRPAIAKLESTAKFKLERNYTIRNLNITLSVYDRWLSNQQLPKADKKTLWEVGIDAGLNRHAARDAVSDRREERMEGRNTLSALVSRYVRQAKGMIESAALGRFPHH
jgi:hypothetical protein